MPIGYGSKHRTGDLLSGDDHYKRSFDGDWSYFHDRWHSRGEFNAALEPLISQLTMYDGLRRELEEQGGDLDLPINIINTLNKKFAVSGLNRKHEVALSDQESLRAMLRDLGNYECQLQVRKPSSGMPVYYFCRTLRDYRSTYNLILEDLYQSTGYPMPDLRFLKMMRFGHETYYLRLSIFREKALEMLGREEYARAQDEVDEILEKVGRHVFQAAWHEDQHVGMAAADHFGLVKFRYAIELLYLCLSGDLCELRRILNKHVIQFFSDVYRQPAIHGFLCLLNELDGETLARIPQTALKLYPGLSRNFSVFLSIELPWGRGKAKVPLYKLLFANFSRLNIVPRTIAGSEEAAKAADLIEKQSESVIRAIFEGLGGSDTSAGTARKCTIKVKRRW